MSIVWFVHGKLLEQERKEELALHRLAAHGQPKDIKAALGLKETD